MEGWHIRYLVCLIGTSFLASICVAAVAAVVTKNFDATLTAGSYACGMAVALLAVFTFLSGVL